MNDVNVDLVKNRLYIKSEGFLNSEDVQKMRQKISVLVEQLQSGFDIVADHRGYKPSSPEVANLLAEDFALTMEKGANRVVCIVSKHVIGQMQLNRLAKQNNTKILYANSIQEAEKLLASN